MKAFTCEADKEIENLKRLEQKGLAVHWSPRDCAVCAEPYLINVSSACGHAMCVQCWCRWTDEQLPICHLQRRLRVRCACCSAEVSEDPLMNELISSHFAKNPTRFSHAETLRQFMQRRRLQNNPLYPALAQIDCPQAGCLGLGYLGSDTIMCFICEHQWQATDEIVSQDLAQEKAAALASGIKACPKCEIPIEKNGGCDHMTCRCRHEFWWSTLKPYR